MIIKLVWWESLQLIHSLMRRLSTAFYVLNVSLSYNALETWLITHHWDTQLIDNIYFLVSRPNRIAQVLWFIPINVSYFEFYFCHSLNILKFISECIWNYHFRKPILATITNFYGLNTWCLGFEYVTWYVLIKKFCVAGFFFHIAATMKIYASV